MTTTEGLARDAYLGIDVELPDGSIVHCNPLPLATSIEFLELIEKYGQGDIGALRRLLQGFPKAVGAGKAFEQLTPGELVDIVLHFCGARRTPASPTTTGPIPMLSPSGLTP